MQKLVPSEFLFFTECLSNKLFYSCRQSKRVKKPRPTTAVTTVKPVRLYKSSFPPDFLTKSRSLSPDPEVSTASWPKAIPKSPIISRTPSSSGI